MGKVLIIADQQELAESVTTLLEPIGHALFYASDLARGWSQAVEQRVDAILLAAQLDGGQLALLPRLKQLPEPPEVVVIDRAGDPRTAEFALRNDAWDYLVLGANARPIALSLDQALQHREEHSGAVAPVPIDRIKLIGNTPLMKGCFELLGQAAAGNANVLIAGEPGTGKEVFARAIHSNSPRARSRSLDPALRKGNPRSESNFVVVDCTALPETLVESVLFGHAAGECSGAGRAHDGLIAQAHNGTLFMDEIGELPSSMQKAFLHVLQERSYRPVGGQTELESNFRLVAATTRNLEQMVEEGRFRKDLLLRLRSLTIDLPPLRERPQDIADLVRFHTHRLCESYDLPKKGFSVELLDLMAAYTWPGNVRELVQTVDAMLSVAARESTLHARHLPVQLRIQVVCSQLREPKVLVVPKQSENGLPDFKTYRAQAERRYLTDLLRAAHRSIPKACVISGISRSRLYEMLSKHDLIGPG